MFGDVFSRPRGVIGMTPRESGAVILLSGGLDSAANLALAHAAGDSVVLALTADYGQKAVRQEVRAARRVSEVYGVPHEVVEIPWLAQLGRSALTDGREAVPEIASSQLDSLTRIQETAKAVWVPNRNGVLLNIAAAFAESMGANRVIVGFNAEEAVTFPDNSAEFLAAASGALRYSTYGGAVKAVSYTTEWSKTQIVARLAGLTSPRFPMDLIWSCYEGGEQACGRCESCQRFLRASRGWNDA